VQAKQFLTHSTDSPALEAYRQRLATLIAGHDPKWRLSLAELLKAVFALAEQRSSLQTAIEENRIAILAVNDYVNKHAVPHPDMSSGQAKYYPAFYTNGLIWRNILLARPHWRLLLIAKWRLN